MIVGILLAAGRSQRFGTPKLVAYLGGEGEPTREPVVRRAARNLLASRADEVVVVVGHEAGLVRDALAGLPVRFVLNERYSEGLSSSLRMGLESATSLWPSVDAVVVALGDQPSVGASIVDQLIGRFEEHRSIGARGPAVSIVAPSYRGCRGNPVLFAREVFPELLAIRGDRGARDVVEHDPSRVSLVALSCEAPRDVDTPADLRALGGE